MHPTLSQLIEERAAVPAISYARVSSERQLRGEGLRRQRAGNHAWITRHPELNIRLDAEKEDAARSAWKGYHLSCEDSALGALLGMVKAGALKPPLMLIVEHLDRLSRENPWRAQEQLAGLVTRGVLVATTRDDKIYHLESDVGDIITSVVYMSAAHDESEKKAERVSETKRFRVLEAMSTKYVLHKNAPGWLRVNEPISPINRATRKYELMVEHAATVLMIYQMGLYHGAGYICSWLIRENRPAMGRTGCWNIRHVRRILKSRAVLGHLESRHGLIQDIFPPIPGLAEELWLRVQAAQRERRDTAKGGYRVGSHSNLLSGIGICAACRGKMRINMRVGRRYFECQNHVVLKTCENRSRYRVDRIENALFDHLDFLAISGVPGVPAAGVAFLMEEHAKLVARQKRLEATLQELDDDEMGNTVISQLRQLRGKVKDAATAVNVAQQQQAVASTEVKLSRFADRGEIADGLRLRLERVLFQQDRSVQFMSKAGLLLVVPSQDTVALMFKAPDGKATVLRNGKLDNAIGALSDLIPSLDAHTNSEVQSLLKETRRLS